MHPIEQRFEDTLKALSTNPRGYMVIIAKDGHGVDTQEFHAETMCALYEKMKNSYYVHIAKGDTIISGGTYSMCCFGNYHTESFDIKEPNGIVYVGKNIYLVPKKDDILKINMELYDALDNIRRPIGMGEDYVDPEKKVLLDKLEMLINDHQQNKKFTLGFAD